MVVLYDKTATAFDSLGLGTLTDFLVLPSITEALNGEYYVEFEYIRGGKNAQYLLEDNLIKVLGQAFRIENAEPTLKGIRVLARHIAFDLRNNFIEDSYPKKLTAQEALDWILGRALFTSRFYVSGTCTKTANARYQKLSVYDALYTSDNAILKRFGGEIEFDNYHIILHKKRGSETNLEIRERKNLKGIEIKKDYSTIKTRLMPVGSNGIVLPEKYIDSPYLNYYFEPKIGKVSITTDTEQTLEEQYTEMRDAVNEAYENGIDLPSISIKVDFLELSKTKEYEKFKSLQTAHLGDIVRVYVPSLHTNLKVRIIKVLKNGITGEIEKLELGSEMDNIVSSISKSTQIIREEIHESASISLDTFRKEATEMLNHPFNGHLFISKETGEIFIMDSNDVNSAQHIWKWGLGGLGFSEVGINGPYKTAWTQDGKFNADFIATGKINTGVIEGYDNLVLKLNNLSDNSDTVTQLELDLKRIEGKISDSFDLTTFVKGENVVSLDSVATSEPIMLVVHPTTRDITYLYPSDDLHLADDLYLLSRTVIFENKTTNEKIYYDLPTDLLVLGETYDEFILNNDSRECKVIKRISINSSGEKYILTTPQTKKFSYPQIPLKEGNYTIRMLSFEQAYFEFRAISINPYSDQFVPQVTYESNRIQTEKYINDSLKLKLGTEEFETYRKQTATLIKDMIKNSDFESYVEQTAKEISQRVKSDNIISTINQSAENVSINANKINITANDILNLISNNSINLKTRNIKIESNNFSVTAEGLLTASNVNISGKINATSGSFTGKIVSESGKIGGFDIGANSITSTHNDYYVYVGNASNTNKDFLCVRTGTTGNYKYPFYVRGDGSFYSEKGKIANWTITTGKIYGGDSTTGVAAIQVPSGNMQWVFAAGGTSHDAYANCPFRVSKSGELYATKAHITGSITATSGSFTGNVHASGGTIGGFNIGSDRLYYGNTAINRNGNVEFRNDNGYLSIGNVCVNLNGSGMRHPVVISDQLACGSTGDSNASIGIRAFYGNVKIASNEWLNMSGALGAYLNNQHYAGTSSRNTKKNIKELTKEQIDEVYDIFKNLKFYQYDYQEAYGGIKNNYGFLIEDIENTILDKIMHIFRDDKDKNYKNYNSEDLTRLLLIIMQKIMKEVESMKEMIKL